MHVGLLAKIDNTRVDLSVGSNDNFSASHLQLDSETEIAIKISRQMQGGYFTAKPIA